MTGPAWCSARICIRPRKRASRPKVERLKLDGVNLPAIVSDHSGSPYTAVEWLFKPRQ
jgi:hypothetical protein